MQLICKKHVLKRKHFQFFLRSTPSAWRKRRGPRKTMILSRNVTSVKDTLEKTWCIPLNSTWQRPPIVSSADVSLDVRIGAPCIYYLIFWHGFFIHCFIHYTIFERELSCSWWRWLRHTVGWYLSGLRPSCLYNCRDPFLYHLRFIVIIISLMP